MNLIFDFDGTICDSFKEAINIIKKNYPKYYSGEFSPDAARKMGFKKVLKKTGFPKHKLPKLIILGRKELAKKTPKLKTYKGIDKVIKKLAEENDLGIVTSNSEDNVKKFLKNNHLENHFDFIHSSFSFFSKHKKLKQAIDEEQMELKDTIYIGDETRDVEAGKKVRVKTIAVTWGFEAENILKKANPDLIVSQPKGLTGVIQSLSKK